MKFTSGMKKYHEDKDHIVFRETTEGNINIDINGDIEKQLQLSVAKINYAEIKERLSTDITFLDKQGVLLQLNYICKAKQDVFEIYILACRNRQYFKKKYDSAMWNWGQEFQEETKVSPNKSWAGYEKQFKQWLSAKRGAEYWMLENKLINFREHRGLFEQLKYNLCEKEKNLRLVLQNML